MTPQQILDTAGMFDVCSDTPLTVPLFLDSGMWLLGTPRGQLTQYDAGHAIVIGWRRGLIGDEHYPAVGYRTHGNSFLIGHGTEWDLGPMDAGARGWQTVTRLRVKTTVTKHFAESWENKVLAGINAGQLGYAPHPRPWVLWVNSGLAKLEITKADGSVQTFTQAVTDTDAQLVIDIDTGELGTTLFPNTITPFGMGRTPPYGLNEGYWGSAGPYDDITFETFEVHTNGTMRCLLQDGRPATYPGGPSLPLVKGWTYQGGRYLLVIDPTQGPADTANDVRMEGVQITGSTSASPLVTLGVIFGGALQIRDCRFSGGTRAIQSSGLFVNYPITVADSHMSHQSDCNAWLLGSSGVTFDRVQMNFANRCCAELLSCNAWIKGEVILAPPGPPPQEAIFIQQGGHVRYDRIATDYEYTPGPEAFLKLRGDGIYAPSAPTRARLSGCRDVEPLAVNLGPVPGYTGDITIITED